MIDSSTKTGLWIHFKQLFLIRPLSQFISRSYCSVSTGGGEKGHVPPISGGEPTGLVEAAAKFFRARLFLPPPSFQYLVPPLMCTCLNIVMLVWSTLSTPSQLRRSRPTVKKPLTHSPHSSQCHESSSVCHNVHVKYATLLLFLAAYG